MKVYFEYRDKHGIIQGWSDDFTFTTMDNIEKRARYLLTNPAHWYICKVILHRADDDEIIASW